MMDHKTWLWKKKSTEKTLVAADKANISQRVNEEEIQTLLSDKTELGRNLKILNEKLSSALSECIAKDDLVEKQEKMAQEALSGWEKAESEAISLKKELNDILRQRVAGEERLTHLDMALKECMQQLRFVREEQEQRIHDAVMKTSKEFERARIALEEKLADTNRRLSKLGVENSQLSKALLAKEKLIEDVNEQRARGQADFNALMTRLESTEKENASLKYEVRVLEKQLEIRNEEREFNSRTADVAHKQYLESVKKIAKLDSECQRLRVLVRKRLPGPAAVAKMKNEVEMLGKDQAETRSRKSNPSSTGSTDFAMDNVPDTPSKRIDYLVEKLCAMEEENRSLKETLNEKTNDFQYSRTMYAHNASSMGHIAMEPSKNITIPHELSLASLSDMGSDDKVNCAESWAPALIPELEHFRNGKQMGTPLQKNVGASDIDLMDDFVEMERLATVSVDKQFGSSRLASVEGSEIVGPLKIQSGGDSLAAAGRKKGAVHSEVGDEISMRKKSNYQVQSNLSKSICKAIGLIEGISLPSLDYGASEFLTGKDGSDFPYTKSEEPSDYLVRVFQWKTSELSAVLQQFVQTCNDLLTGNADFEKFVEELTSSLEWVMNHCFSLQDVSSMREAIKKQFDWDESRSESEVEVGTLSQFPEADKLHVLKEKSSHLHIVSAWNDRKREKTLPNVREENKNLKEELSNMESANKDLEGRLQSEIVKSESLMIKLKESEETSKSLLRELETLKESIGVIENQYENHELGNEDLDTQLKIGRIELNEVGQRFSTLQAEMESKNDSCQESEATCVDLQLQLESLTKNDPPNFEAAREENQIRTNWEITAASEKLAECQETILNLGKQLKALAIPKDTAPFFNPVSNPSGNIPTTTTPKKSVNQRFSLLDKMLAEDNGEPGDLKFPKTAEVICIPDPQKPTVLDGISGSAFQPIGTVDFHHMNGIKHNEKEAVGSPLAIVPARKKGGGGGGLFKKLLWTRNRGKSKKLTLPFGA